MTRQNRLAKVNVFFGEDEFEFKLGIEQLIELQEKLDEGPGVTLARLSNGLYGNWKIETIKDTIRLALIGAGMDKKKAYDLVSRNVTAGYIFESLLVAQLVLSAAIVGVDEDKPGETLGEGSQTQESLSPTERSDGLTTSEPAL